MSKEKEKKIVRVDHDVWVGDVIVWADVLEEEVGETSEYMENSKESEEAPNKNQPE